MKPIKSATITEELRIKVSDIAKEFETLTEVIEYLKRGPTHETC